MFLTFDSLFFFILFFFFFFFSFSFLSLLGKLLGTFTAWSFGTLLLHSYRLSVLLLHGEKSWRAFFSLFPCFSFRFFFSFSFIIIDPSGRTRCWRTPVWPEGVSCTFFYDSSVNVIVNQLLPRLKLNVVELSPRLSLVRPNGDKHDLVFQQLIILSFILVVITSISAAGCARTRRRRMRTDCFRRWGT